MTPFIPVSKPFHTDFFSIIDQNGEKCIHLHGYTYMSDSEEFVTEDNPDGVYWANMEACGIIVPVKEFVQNFQNDKEFEYVDTLYQEAKQYQGDYDEVSIVRVINHYYSEIVFSLNGKPRGEGNPDAYLDYGEVTEDTPYGQYLTYPAYEEIEL